MKDLLNYLGELEQNNQRDWFAQTAVRRKHVLGAFQGLVGALALSIGQDDPDIGFPDPKAMTFSLVRDTRFSRDKTPYNPSLRAHISPRGKLPIPTGYFIRLMPGNRSLLAGGLSTPGLRQATLMVRSHIDAHGPRLRKILERPAFKRHFTLTGERLVHVPRDYPADHPDGDLLRHKSWRVECPLTDAQVLSDDFIRQATEIFGIMRPFKDFVNQALEGFSLPEGW